MCFFTAKKKKYIFLWIVGLYGFSSLPPFCFHPCLKVGALARGRLVGNDKHWRRVISVCMYTLALGLVFAWWFRASCEYLDNCSSETEWCIIPLADKRSGNEALLITGSRQTGQGIVLPGESEGPNEKEKQEKNHKLIEYPPPCVLLLSLNGSGGNSLGAFWIKERDLSNHFRCAPYSKVSKKTTKSERLHKPH